MLQVLARSCLPQQIFNFSSNLLTRCNETAKEFDVEEKVVVIHRGRCNNKVYYCLSYDVVTLDVDPDVSTAYC